MKTEKQILLRSQKVRAIMERKPPLFVMYGTVLITLFLVVLLLLAYITPYNLETVEEHFQRTDSIPTPNPSRNQTIWQKVFSQN